MTRDARWAAARCNDGTPFDFQVRLAETRSKAWVIYLEGGRYCDELSSSCTQRSPELATTLPQADRSLGPITRDGVLSRDPAINPLATANHVFAHYCSSDMWAGATTERRPTSAAAEGWYFSGHANVAAMLDVLAKRYGMDDADPGTEVLFGGGSAGGFGARFNLSVAEGALPQTITREQVRLFVDAGWMAEWNDLDPAPPDFHMFDATVPDRDVWKAARAFWGATFDPACEAAESEPFRCFWGRVWYQHAAKRVPILVQQSSIDSSFRAAHDLVPNPSDPKHDDERAAATQVWKAETESSLAEVAWLFSGDTAYHVLGGGNLRIGPPGSSLSEVIGRFWADGQPERIEF